MKILLLFLFIYTSLFSSPVILTHEEKLFINKHPVLRIQNERNWAPIDFRENAQAKGYAVDYITLLATKAGFKVKFYPGRSWATYLQMLDEKKLDIISSMKITPQRENYAIFSKEPSLELFHAILQRDDANILSMQDLKGKRVAVIKDHYQERVLSLNFPDITLVYADNKIEAMQMVVNKEVDATIGYYSIFQHNIQKHSFVGLHAFALKGDSYFQSTKQYVAIREDWPLLKSILDKVQSSLPEKEVHQLRARWLGELQDKYTQLTQKESAYLKNKKILRFCSDPNWLPIEKIKDAHLIGISADYLQIISEKIRTPFTLVPTTSWTESLTFIKTGRCDFLSSAIRTKERDKSLNFSSSYLDSSLVVVTKDDSFFVHSLQGLEDKKIGVVKDYGYDEFLLHDNPDLNLVYVSDTYAGMKAVEEAKIYAFVSSLEVSSYQLRTHSFSDLKISGELDNKIKLSFAVKKEDFMLFNILEKSLNSISTQQRKEIYDRWVSVNIDKIDYSLFIKIFITLVLVLAFFAYRHKMALNYNNKLLLMNKELEDLNAKLQELSQTDQLTQISNRRHLDSTLIKEIKRALRHNTSLCLILIDIDFFKRINDTYGHQKGDEVLISIANILKNNSRGTDIVGRWGGEEFLIILSQVDLLQATEMAEKLRKKIRDFNFKLKGNITASFGVTQYIHDKDDESSLLSRVDANLYEAKDSGRDKIISS